MNERRIAELCESLSACKGCFLKRLQRYMKDWNVRNLEESLKRLDAMTEHIEKIREEITNEIERRASIA